MSCEAHAAIAQPVVPLLNLLSDVDPFFAAGNESVAGKVGAAGPAPTAARHRELRGANACSGCARRVHQDEATLPRQHRAGGLILLDGHRQICGIRRVHLRQVR